jgi:hypothetical protein
MISYISCRNTSKVSSTTENPTSPFCPPRTAFYDAMIQHFSWLRSALATSVSSTITLHQYNPKTLTSGLASKTTRSAPRRLLHSWLQIIHLPRHLCAGILTYSHTSQSEVLEELIIPGHDCCWVTQQRLICGSRYLYGMF